MQRIVRKVLRVVADYDPEYYDMYEDRNESFFAMLYVERIMRHVREAGVPPHASLLEAGCQAGRLLIPFAKLGFSVTGIDTSIFALRRAREHVKAAGVNARFARGDLLKVLQAHPDWQYDVVVCAEVIYLSPHYREILRVLANAVRPGGLLCVSHRPKFYYLWEALKRYDLTTAAQVLSRSEGAFRDSAYYNWQTSDELHALYRELGLRWIASYPIDRLAWLGGRDPSQMTGPQRHRLRTMELQLSGDGASDGRYILVVASRPKQPC